MILSPATPAKCLPLWVARGIWRGKAVAAIHPSAGPTGCPFSFNAALSAFVENAVLGESAADTAPEPSVMLGTSKDRTSLGFTIRAPSSPCLFVSLRGCVRPLIRNSKSAIPVPLRALRGCVHPLKHLTRAKHSRGVFKIHSEDLVHLRNLLNLRIPRRMLSPYISPIPDSRFPIRDSQFAILLSPRVAHR